MIPFHRCPPPSCSKVSQLAFVPPDGCKATSSFADSEFFEKVTCNLNELGETCVDGALNAYLLSMLKYGDPFIHGNFRSTCHGFNLVFYRLEEFNRDDGKNPILVFIDGRENLNLRKYIFGTTLVLTGIFDIVGSHHQSDILDKHKCNVSDQALIAYIFGVAIVLDVFRTASVMENYEDT